MCVSFEQKWNGLLQPVVPQLSKYLKFEAVWVLLNWSNDLNLDKEI